MKKYKYLFIYIILLVMLFSISCNKELEIQNIEINNLDEVSILSQGKFMLSDIELKIIYTDSTSKIINLQSSMMTEEDSDKFKQVGSHEVYIYVGDKNTKFTFTILENTKEANNFSDLEFVIEDDNYIYNGLAIKPDVEVYDGDKLTLNSDYQIQYLNNINAGTGIIILTGINNYQGEKVLTFTINPKDLIIKANDLELTGNDEPNFNVTYEGFAYLDDKNSLMGSLDISCNYDKSKSGEYEISVSGLKSTNYNIIYQNGILRLNNIYLDNAAIELEYYEHAYNGKTLEPDVYLKLDGNIISSYDYDIEYVDNKNVGKAKVIITGKGLYYGSLEASFEITKVNLEISVNNEIITFLDPIPNYTVNYIGFVSLESKDDLLGNLVIDCDYDATNIGTFIISPSGYESNNYNIIYKNGILTVNKCLVDKVNLEYEEIIYTGFENEPITSVYAVNTELVKDRDYEVSYTNNLNSGSALVTIIGKGNFKGTITKSFQVLKAQLTLKVENQDIEYGMENEPFTYTLTGLLGSDNKDVLNGLIEYKTTFTKLSNVGSYDVYAQGITANNYKINFEKGVIKVNKRNIQKEDVLLKKNEYEYTGVEINPLFSINSLRTLTKDVDYTYTLENNISAGTGTIIITGINNYENTIEINFSIVKKDLYVTLSNHNLNYGDDLQGEKITYKGFVSGEDENCLIGTPQIITSYKKYSNIGEYELDVTNISSNNYNLIIEKGLIKVSPKTIDKNLLSQFNKEFTYTGNDILCDISLSYLDYDLVKDKDYQIEYENNINYGKASFTIKGINNFTGVINESFNINKRDIVITSNNYNIKYLESVDLNYSIDNVINQEDLNLLRNEITLTTSYKIGSFKGEYPITFDYYSNNNYNITFINGIINVDYSSEFIGKGKQNEPYLLSSVNDIMLLSEKVLNGQTFENCYFELTQTINFNNYMLKVIGDSKNEFKGTLNGNGYEIKNYNIEKSLSSYIGLFGNINNATISNLGLVNVNISENNGTYLGTICGYAKDSIISNVYVNNLEIKNSASTTIGTLIGQCENSIINNVYTISNLEITGNNVNLGLLVGNVINSTIESAYTVSNGLISITSGNVALVSLAKNKSRLMNIFIDGNISVTSTNVNTYEITDNIKSTFTENILLLDTLTFTKNEESININKTSLNNALTIFKDNCDNTIWTILDNEYPLFQFIEKDGIHYINKPMSITKVYDGLDFSLYGTIVNEKVCNCGKYRITLKLLDGFKWSDGTTDDCEIDLEIIKKDLYITINSISIDVNDSYELSYKQVGLLDKDSNLLDSFMLYSDFNLSYGTYEIYYDTLLLDNYNVIVNKGYMYVHDNKMNSWSIWDGIIEDKELTGEGTDQKPYLINSASDLAALAYKVNNGLNTKYYYQLTTNIDLNYHNWIPIGCDGNFFTGIFEGNDYEIRNLCVNKEYRYTGLFGYTKNSKIMNLKITNAFIKGETFSQTTIGILASFLLNSEVDKVSVQGQINIDILCSENIIVGGLVGLVSEDSVINNITVDASINILNRDSNSSTSPLNVGGIVGYLQKGSINNGYILGDITINNQKNRTFAGGIVGYVNEGNLSSLISYANINVLSQTKTTDYLVGGNKQGIFNNIIALDSLNVTVNGDDVIISIGIINSEDELLDFIDNSFDKYVWFNTDTLYPTPFR